jgi:hypothetical protein
MKADGTVVLARGGPPWQEQDLRPFELDMGVYDLAGKPDAYITQNRFSGSRRLVQDVSTLTCLYADLDYYNVPELAGRPPEAVLEKALEKVPEPSLAISSGRGLCLVWQHKAVGRTELPRWNDAQHSLYRSLKVVGADVKAKDAARVFRLIGTVNSKNGAMVRTLHNGGHVYDFEKLAEALPVVEEQDAEVYDLRVQRAARGGFKGPRVWTEETLWESRLTDFQTLRHLRFGHRGMSDFRDRWLFLAGVAMSWLVDSHALLERELLGLAEEIGWSDRRKARQKMGQVFERVVMAARGDDRRVQGPGVGPALSLQQRDLDRVAGDRARGRTTDDLDHQRPGVPAPEAGTRQGVPEEAAPVSR